MPEAFICSYTRTPIGRFGGALSSVRTDDLAAVPLSALKAKHTDIDWEAVDDVLYEDKVIFRAMTLTVEAGK